MQLSSIAIRLVGVAAALGALAGTPEARATERADDVSADGPPARAATSSQAGALLPMTVAPRVDAQRALVVVTSGYDSAHAAPTLLGAAEMRIWGPTALRAGFSYLPDGGAHPFQPHFGIRAQLLRQDAHGVDGAVGLAYRMDRFIEDEGLVQVMASAGRRFDRLGVFADASYGQDPEGDDRDGEVRAAALYEVTSALHVGVDGRLRFDLFSDDPRRASRGESGLDYAVGPIGSFSLGRFAVIGQVGASGVRVLRLRSGVLATMGVASVF